LKRTFFSKKHHHHSAREFPLLGLNFNKGAIILPGIKQLYKAKEAMHLHKKINFKEKSFKAIVNPSYTEGQIEIKIQTE